MNLGDRESRALRPDAQAFDEIRIITVPRYKTSGLSGDEWRISGKTEFYRKGELVHDVWHGNVEYCARLLDADLLHAIDDGRAFYAGIEGKCDQEGCSEPPTVKYRIKKNFCREGHETDPPWITTRSFCQRHSRRGDCGLDDADINYELVEGDVGSPKADDISESSRVVCAVDRIEDIPQAVSNIRAELKRADQ